MLSYKTIDATSIRTGIIAHGVNCQNRMGSGIAKTIRQKWPEVYDAYMRQTRGAAMIGTGHIICVNYEQRLYVANMYTQVFYGHDGGKYADADAIEKALRYVAGWSDGYDLPVYMPRIGCGLGGLNWMKDVYDRVMRVATEFPDIDIVVCDLPSQKEDKTNEFVTY